MRPFRFFYQYSKEQQKGVLVLLVVILLVQLAYYAIDAFGVTTENKKSVEEKEWLAHQAEIDSLKENNSNKKFKIYPFNPNFISDYKGYTLGMSVEEIDRLHTYRAEDKYVNSATEFQQVTKVSDSLLNTISPYFKFPDWVKNKKQTKRVRVVNGAVKHERSIYKPKNDEPEIKIALDINTATDEDLVKVYGIGKVFAKRILRKREKLGAFVSMKQMDEFPAFSPEAVLGLKKAFTVIDTSGIKRIDINAASLNKLRYFEYFNKDIARAIITERSMKGKISGIKQLSKINGFPVEKEDIIALYLKF